MDNASKNAKDMIDTLTMQYNRGRQAAITNELVDIITGRLNSFVDMHSLTTDVQVLVHCEKYQSLIDTKSLPPDSEINLDFIAAPWNYV